MRRHTQWKQVSLTDYAHGMRLTGMVVLSVAAGDILENCEIGKPSKLATDLKNM